MKKLYCLALVILSLFSCVLFSACGNKYKNLQMSFYNKDGDAITEINFVLDSEIEDVSQRVYIQFNKIDKADIDEVSVYSMPEGLVTVDNYAYEGKKCYVTINPAKVSEEGAKLYVKHHASNKTASIDLTIKQKAKDVFLHNNEYTVSILETGVNTHVLNFSKLGTLQPELSSDKVYFKLASGSSLKNGVTTISSNVSGCYSGFRVPANIDAFSIVVYPVTHLEGYNPDEYSKKPITIHFKKALSQSKISLKFKDEEIKQTLKLVYNDPSLENAVVKIYNGDKVVDLQYYDLYDLVVITSDNSNKITTFTDANNNINIKANANTDYEVDVLVQFIPKENGDLYIISKKFKVKSETKADAINVRKNGEEIDTTKTTSIFDYYEEGNSLGSLFTFKPYAYSAASVNVDLKQMQIVVEPEILNADATSTIEGLNVVYTSNNFNELSNTNKYSYNQTTKTVNSKLYALSLHKFSEPLKFYYNEYTGMMVSELFSENDRIYIKYVAGKGNTEPINFGVKVETVNNSTISYWSTINSTTVSVVFDRQEGVKSMTLDAGYHKIDGGIQSWNSYQKENMQEVYLNRLEGLDNPEINTKYIYINTIKGVDNEPLANANFEVVVTPPKGATNLLKIKDTASLVDGSSDNNDIGELSLNYVYQSHTENDYSVIGLVFRENTDIGTYTITFYQGGIEKASVKCNVYEALRGVDKTNIFVEENLNSFKNETYSDINSDYIVSANQKLDISLILNEDILNSNVVAEYTFDFNIGTYKEDIFTVNNDVLKTDYVFKNQDKVTDKTANFEFKKGTIIKNVYNYVEITIKVKTYEYATIVSEPIADYLLVNLVTFRIFVYQPITNELISISDLSATRYIGDYLGAYYDKENALDLSIEMEEDLWQYVTKQNDQYVIWTVEDNTGITSDRAGVTPEEKNEGKLYSLKFGKITGVNSYQKIAKAYIQQFNHTFYFECVINVEKPIITEKIVIESPLKEKSTDNREYYINLKLGEEYTVKASNISSLGNVTHGGIIIQVADKQGSAYTARDYFDINQDISTIKVKKVEGAPEFKLIVFAKDAMKYLATSGMSGYNDPSSFLMESGSVENPDLYKNAYFVINIELSDGSATNPYLITTIKELYAIDDTEVFAQANYKLMNGLNLGNALGEPIQDFYGNIVTDDDFEFIISGITLQDGFENLFINFNGTIKNIKFIVKYDYKQTTKQNLGVFDINNGTLTNVRCEVAGSAHFTSNNVIGGLVGQNAGTITYTSGVGVSGEITLTQNANLKVYFGGLVGKNINKIEGNETSASAGGTNNFVFNLASGRSDVLSCLVINSSLIGEGAIGGLVGLNTYTDTTAGIIHNAYVQAEINAEQTSNVGGVIGENNVTPETINVNYGANYLEGVTNVLVDNYYKKAIYNVKSASTINANNNVGGIVGKDNGGLYIECDYQILPQNNKQTSIKANNAVGGIAGISTYGKFFYCSVMSYNWNYASLQTDLSDVIGNDVEDISGNDYVAGIVGKAISNYVSFTSGDNALTSNVVVAYSSVDAYLTQSAENGNIGGVICSTNEANDDTTKINTGVLFNVYFVGMLEGNVQYITMQTTNNGIKQHDLCISNNNNYAYNFVYNINLVYESGTWIPKTAGINDGKALTINGDPNANYWFFNSSIHGGYIFITTDTTSENKLPIFDLSPDSVTVTVKKDIDGYIDDKTIRLYYFDFAINNLNYDTLSDLDNKYNRNQYIKDNLNIIATPSNMGTIVLNVVSSNTGIVDVSYDGRLLINGVGECEITFSSILNPNAGVLEDRTIKIVVEHPIGDEFIISTSKTDVLRTVNDSTQSIPKGTSKQYFVITSGTVVEGYKYISKTNVNLKVKVSTNAYNVTISDYVRISGLTGDVSGDDLVFNVNNKTPFTISMLKHLENEKFNIEITPYAIINQKEYEYDKTASFDITSMQGATDVSLSFDHAIVYPNDTIYLTTYINTDVAICGETKDGKVIINCETLQEEFNRLLNGDNLNGLTINITNTDIPFNIYVDSSTYNKDTSIQTITLRIEFGEMKLTTETKLGLEFETTLGTSAQVDFNILPQRISQIEIKNYYYKDETNKELLNVLKPSYPGLLILDIVPNNGYYDYLEISDITGSEEIVFIQVDENGNVVNVNGDDISSDGKGIKLYKQQGVDNSRIYVRTQISRLYSSKLHTIEVRAYTASDEQIGNGFTKEIDVKMLPEITVDYLLPDGSVSTDSSKHNILLANGVDANLLIVTKNSNGEVIPEISGNAGANYKFVHEVGNHYLLKATEKSNVGEAVTLTLKTYSYMENGDYEMAETSISFKIVDFVIHDISVNSSIDNASTKEIYGYYDKPIKLNFYFDKNDISFYDDTAENDKFWDTVYEWDNSIDLTKIENSNLKQIYTILSEINKQYEDVNPYLILNDGKFEGGEYTYTLTPDNVELYNNELEVLYNNEDKGEYNPKHLAVAFKLSYDGSNGWEINSFNQDVGSKTNYVVNKNYYLNFKVAQSLYEATVITTEEQFRAMESGGRYILATDLTGDKALKNYTPIDADLLEFDGNGRTIEIQSFASFNEEIINAGLFAKIYPNMIVKNVNVTYTSINEDGNPTFGDITADGITYTDLCNNAEVNYTEARFGGIAAVNYGMVTNCNVNGKIAINASTIEQKKFSSGSNYSIDFYIGGMVAENATDTESDTLGTITNSTSELTIFALANIGGFVYTNDGKIASCGVENPTIYAYNPKLEKTISISVAGFVVDNSNEISMSYVNFTADNTAVDYPSNITKGTMSAKDFSAGFVYSNNGDIYDAYVNMVSTGVNNNIFSGFVFENSGTITRAYSYINDGNKDASDNMFAPAGSSGLTDCIEFLNSKDGYTSGVEGLTTLSVTNRYSRFEYESHNFTFGDNENAVWKIESSNLPVLVATQEKVVYTGDSGEIGGLMMFTTSIEDIEGGTLTTYKPNPAYYGTKENPYIIHNLETYIEYFKDNSNAYYRFIRDIDFSSIGDNPSTSSLTFKGNIQGNNMQLKGILLYTSSSLDAIGLFKHMQSAEDNSIVNAVRNLKLNASSVWASNTQAVGLLAGIIEDFHIYNIAIDAEDVIMVGGNAVGGLAGVVRGDLGVGQITSNISVNSTRATTINNYSIYLSKNNQVDMSYNLQDVYYAGSVAGIVDAYNYSNFNINDVRDITRQYYDVENIRVNGSVVVAGDTVGAAFGLIGERVYAKNIKVNISGSFAGKQYSAGAIGENRGVVEDIEVVINADMFKQAGYVSAGLIGLNLGGFVRNVTVTANISKSDHAYTVAGVIGRNIHGTITEATFNGELFGYFTGGIVGANYSGETLKETTAGNGAISDICKTDYVIPNEYVKYVDDTVEYFEIEDGKAKETLNFTNLTLTSKTINYLLENITKYYSYHKIQNADDNLSTITNKYKVLGFVVGLNANSENNNFNNKIYKKSNGDLLFNSTSSDSLVSKEIVNDFILQEGENANDNVTYTFKNVCTLSYGKGNFVVYINGASVTAFDVWEAYSEDYILFT